MASYNLLGLEKTDEGVLAPDSADGLLPSYDELRAVESQHPYSNQGVSREEREWYGSLRAMVSITGMCQVLGVEPHGFFRGKKVLDVGGGFVEYDDPMEYPPMFSRIIQDVLGGIGISMDTGHLDSEQRRLLGCEYLPDDILTIFREPELSLLESYALSDSNNPYVMRVKPPYHVIHSRMLFGENPAPQFYLDQRAHRLGFPDMESLERLFREFALRHLVEGGVLATDEGWYRVVYVKRGGELVFHSRY